MISNLTYSCDLFINYFSIGSTLLLLLYMSFAKPGRTLWNLAFCKGRYKPDYAAYELMSKKNISLNIEIVALKNELWAFSEQLELAYVKIDKLNDHLVDILDSLDLPVEYKEHAWNWSVDIDSEQLFLSDYGLQVMGLPKGSMLKWKDYLNVIDDQYRYDVETALSLSIKTGGDFFMKYKIKPIDGSPEKWIRSTGKVVCSDNGVPIEIVGRFALILGDPLII